ncbi:hypothetical protein [Streptomyces atratus]|uniref:hypothetical protein n=2 Tax=Streptomyces TaxID=1883 RepID=UPI0037970171
MLSATGSWAAYAEAEFGISRAQAYRLIEVSRAAGIVGDAVIAADPVSCMRDTDTAAALDFGLSQRVLLAVSGCAEQVADLIARRLAPLLAVSALAIGELMLEVAPAYLSDHQAADRLALLCDEIGETLDHGLAVRRYALTGD